jgi:hypothetical protein
MPRRYKNVELRRAYNRSVPDRHLRSAKEVSFDAEQAYRVARRLLDTYDTLFKDGILIPEHKAVQGLEPVWQARLLLLAVGSDRRSTSERHYPKFREAYNQHPSFVDPAHIGRMNQSAARAHMNHYFSIGMTSVADGLWKMSSTIANEYGNDPRNLFEKDMSVHDAIARVSRGPHKLPGIGEQMAKLLIKNYTELDLVTLRDAHELPPKVDVHNLLLTIGTGILKFPDFGSATCAHYRRDQLVQIVSRGWKQVCAEHEDVQGSALNNIIWNLGSRRCAQHTHYACNGCSLYNANKAESICQRRPQPANADGWIDVRSDARRPAAPAEQLILFENVRK